MIFSAVLRLANYSVISSMTVHIIIFTTAIQHHIPIFTFEKFTMTIIITRTLISVTLQNLKFLLKRSNRDLHRNAVWGCFLWPLSNSGDAVLNNTQALWQYKRLFLAIPDGLFLYAYFLGDRYSQNAKNFLCITFLNEQAFAFFQMKRLLPSHLLTRLLMVPTSKDCLREKLKAFWVSGMPLSVCDGKGSVFF